MLQLFLLLGILYIKVYLHKQVIGLYCVTNTGVFNASLLGIN